MECELSYYFEVLETIENPELVMRGNEAPWCPAKAGSTLRSDKQQGITA